MIRWSIHEIGFQETLKEHCCFRRYIWQNELDNSEIPEVK